MASQNRTHASDRGKAVVDIPTVPTIGTATAGAESATVAYTAATKGGPATTFTALSNPGSITGTGSSSPITVTGLTAGTAYTFTIKGNNATGSSEYSSASNSITPLLDPQAFESIATINGNGSSTSITFNSIPSTYKHLQVRALVKSNLTGNPSAMRMQLNGVTTGYFDHGLYGNGSTVGAYGRTNVDTAGSSYIAGNGLANAYAAVIIDILDYTNTNKNKTVRTLSGADFNGSGQVRFSSGSLASTSAITSLTFEDANSAVAFYQYSSFALYGIKG